MGTKDYSGSYARESKISKFKIENFYKHEDQEIMLPRQVYDNWICQKKLNSGTSCKAVLLDHKGEYRYSFGKPREWVIIDTDVFIVEVTPNGIYTILEFLEDAPEEIYFHDSISFKPTHHGMGGYYEINNFQQLNLLEVFDNDKDTKQA